MDVSLINVENRDKHGKNQEKSSKFTGQLSTSFELSPVNGVENEGSCDVPALPSDKDSNLIADNSIGLFNASSNADFSANGNFVDLFRNNKNETIQNHSISQTHINKDSAVDIGNYAGSKMNDVIKRQLLLKPWTPPKKLQFSIL